MDKTQLSGRAEGLQDLEGRMPPERFAARTETLPRSRKIEGWPPGLHGIHGVPDRRGHRHGMEQAQAAYLQKERM
ncbi:MAG: hypothetical protein DUD30_05610 [Lactobacillus sp.]|nr:MAG: hypothetical protein DUD30_05610 [Lactobacillus sp.]